jgi:hypothetical protein
VIERAIVTDKGRFANYDTHAVVDEKASPDYGARMNFYARKPASDVG